MRYLEQVPSGRRYVWTADLAKRADMREVHGDSDAPLAPVRPKPVEAPELSAADESAAYTREDLDGMHWKQLQQLLEARGESYTDKAAAIDILTGAAK